MTYEVYGINIIGFLRIFIIKYWPNVYSRVSVYYPTLRVLINFQLASKHQFTGVLFVLPGLSTFIKRLQAGDGCTYLGLRNPKSLVQSPFADGSR